MWYIGDWYTTSWCVDLDYCEVNQGEYINPYTWLYVQIACDTYCGFETSMLCDAVLIVVVVATVGIVIVITDISICVVLTGVNRKDICDSMSSSHMRGGLWYTVHVFVVCAH